MSLVDELRYIFQVNCMDDRVGIMTTLAFQWGGTWTKEDMDGFLTKSFLSPEK